MGLCVPPDCMSVVTSVPQHQMHSMPAPLRCCHKRSVRGPVWQPWYSHGTPTATCRASLAWDSALAMRACGSSPNGRPAMLSGGHTTRSCYITA